MAGADDPFESKDDDERERIVTAVEGPEVEITDIEEMKGMLLGVVGRRTEEEPARIRYLAPVLAALVLYGMPASAEAQAAGKRCHDVQAGGKRATHVFADFMPCQSARAKLRRWLPRRSMPRKRNGWYCYRLTGRVRACTYPGRRGIADPKSFTFWLRRVARSAQGSIRECGDLRRRRIYNITTRRASCRFARRFARDIFTNPACAEDRYCRFRGFRCTHYNYAIPGGREGDVRCTRRGGRVVRFQYGDGG
jgi:hypothetical protein